MNDGAVTHKRRFCFTCGAQRKVKAVETGRHCEDSGSMLWTDVWSCPNNRWWKFRHYETSEEYDAEVFRQFMP